MAHYILKKKYFCMEKDNNSNNEDCIPKYEKKNFLEETSKLEEQPREYLFPPPPQDIFHSHTSFTERLGNDCKKIIEDKKNRNSGGIIKSINMRKQQCSKQKTQLVKIVWNCIAQEHHEKNSIICPLNYKHEKFPCKSCTGRIFHPGERIILNRNVNCNHGDIQFKNYEPSPEDDSDDDNDKQEHDDDDYEE